MLDSLVYSLLRRKPRHPLPHIRTAERIDLEQGPAWFEQNIRAVGPVRQEELHRNHKQPEAEETPLQFHQSHRNPSRQIHPQRPITFAYAVEGKRLFPGSPSL